MRQIFLALAVLFVACGSDSEEPSGPSAAPVPPANGPRLLVTVQKAARSVIAGGNADVLVAVARDGTDAFDGEVDIALAPAEGITANPIALAREKSSAKLSLSVVAGRKHGEIPLRIVATSRDRTATGEASLPLVVRGKPGELDTSFGTNGIFLLGDANAEATGMALQPDGKLVIGGRIGTEAAVVRLTLEGRLDPTFGNGGKARASIAGLTSTHDIVVVPSGSIVLGANDAASSVLARFTASGALESTFIASAQANARALAAASGNVFFGGRPAQAPDEDGMHVHRMLPDGALDKAWATAGAAVLPYPAAACGFGNGECPVTAISPKPDGKLTVCASRGDGVNIRELFPSGVEDLNYALTTAGDVFSRCNGIVNNTPNDFWAAGARDVDAFAFVHFKISPTGGHLQVDMDTRPVVAPPEALLGQARRLAVAGPGLLIASADTTPDPGPTHVALVRVNAFTLKLDPAFGAGKGFVTTAIGAAGAKSRALVVQGDGRIVVGGTNGDMFAARYWP